MSTLTADAPALTGASVITAANLESFFALPTHDDKLGGDGWKLYFTLCQTKAEGVASALKSLDRGRVEAYESEYQVNFPHLVTMLLEKEQLSIDAVTELLLWFQDVAGDEFNNECFVGGQGNSMIAVFQRVESVPERLGKWATLTRLIGLRHWRWNSLLLSILSEVLPDGGFTRERLAEGLRSAASLPDKSLTESELENILQLLLWSFDRFG